MNKPPVPEGVFLSDSLELLARLPDECLDLVYIDPPFGTGARQRLNSIAASPEGAQRRGDFGGKAATYEIRSSYEYRDDMPFEEYLAWLERNLREIHRTLKETGSLYLHLDWHAAAHARLICDRVFGEERFLNEIIWAYDFGGRARDKWARKHDNILWYAKGPTHTFNRETIERIPYMAPSLVGPEKAARGKIPTDCYSADTDILAKRGWVPFPDLREDDLVASVSEDHEIVYVRTSKLHAYSYRGEMYAIQTKTIDLLVTPNHRLYVKSKHGEKFEFIEAQKANESQYYLLPNKLSWRGVIRDKIKVPETVYSRPDKAIVLPEFEMGDWCEFMGWYLAEGCTVSYRGRAEVNIAQAKPEGRVRIQELLERMGLHYQTTPRGLMICNKQLRDYLKPLGFAIDKHIPRELLELPPAMLKRLYEGLMAGDGHKRKEGERSKEWVYTTTSPKLAGDVQELLIKLGFNSNLRLTIQTNRNWNPRYDIGMRTSKESSVWPARHIRQVPYDGMVYCCTVEPYHTLIVRRNGKASVCGNCWWMTIVPTGSLDRTGYPTQKPLPLLERIIGASSNSGELVADFFGGSGTTAVAAQHLGRRYLTCDQNPAAVEITQERLAAHRAGRSFHPSRAKAAKKSGEASP